MTSTVTATGQTVVPKKLRDRFRMKSGATLDWQDEGNFIRVIIKEKTKNTAGLEWFKRLGRIPAAPRDKRPVEYK